MKLPQFTLRELFLLVVIAAMGCGWWVDQDRIRRELAALQEAKSEFAQERDAFVAGTARIGDAKIAVAEATLQVCDLELEGAMAANRRVRGTVPENELRRLEATRDIARLELERLRTTDELLDSAENKAVATVPVRVSGPLQPYSP
jgi:hypothetical protein